MKCENQDIVGDKYVKNDKECLTYNDTDTLKAWKSHYERLLNVEFMWVSNSPSLYIIEAGIYPSNFDVP